MKTAGLGREDILARIEDFHGHLGPYALLGFRAGQLALARLGAKGHFDLEARVWSGSRPPLSCFADGVQLGSGCTTGKGNLRVEPDEAGLAAVAEFRARPASGPVGQGPRGSEAGPPAGTVPVTASLRIRVRPEVAARAGKWLAEIGDRAAAHRLLDLGDEELFETEAAGPAGGGPGGQSGSGAGA